MPTLTDRAAWLDLLDRLRRQSIDVVSPVLALIAAGQITGIDWAGTAGLLAGGALVTVLAYVAGATGTLLWERLVITVAGAALAVLGTDWAGWLRMDWPTALAAIAASAALSLLRAWMTPPEVRSALSSRR